MNPLLFAPLLGALAASALVLGALLVIWQRPSSHTVGMVMGFGAGALISAIAYELVPESQMNGWGMALGFALGAVVYFVSDWWIDNRGGANRKSINAEAGGSGSSIFLGSLLDGVPESIILGIGLATGAGVSFAFLVAVFVSNIPEGIAGTINLQSVGRSNKTILLMWTGVMLASAIGAAFGYWLVRTLPQADGRSMQAFAAGALLAMLAEAMMPEAFEHGGKAVGLLTVLGFLVAAILSAIE
ncbi:MAG: ZIP family zinc transporter [Chloroflexota bacterium]|nr:MAG: ZIP family zinc transporter [Chloroflexota bacterium]